MSLTRTSPSLRARILQNQRPLVTIRPDGRRQEVSFTERYRGTEYETHYEPVRTVAPSVSRGRMVVLVSGAGAIFMLAVALMSTLG